MSTTDTHGPPHRPPRRASRRSRRGDSGAVSVEVAGFVFPAMLLTILAVTAALHLVAARIDVQAAAASAARAASQQRDPAAASLAAHDAAAADLANRGITCADLTTAVDTSRFQRGGQVAVTLTCRIDLSTLTRASAIPGQYVATATSTAPIDTYRQISREFMNSAAWSGVT